jgi:hypothetical protein
MVMRKNMRDKVHRGRGGKRHGFNACHRTARAAILAVFVFMKGHVRHLAEIGYATVVD